jgi:transposase-like protein
LQATGNIGLKEVAYSVPNGCAVFFASVLPYYNSAEQSRHQRGGQHRRCECILHEIRRRTRIVGSFPDGQSALNLAAARLRHIAGTAWSTKRHRISNC